MFKVDLTCAENSEHFSTKFHYHTNRNYLVIYNMKMAYRMVKYGSGICTVDVCTLSL